MFAIHKISFVLCMTCIVMGVAISLGMIWIPNVNPFLWRLLATNGVVFLGSLSSLTVSRAHSPKTMVDAAQS